MKKKILIASLAAVGVIAGTLAVSAASGRGFIPGQRAGFWKEHKIEFFAENLGIESEELQSRLDEGEKPCDIARDLGISKEEMRENFKAKREEMIQKLLEEGKITEERAERMRENFGKKHPGGCGCGLFRGRANEAQEQAGCGCKGEGGCLLSE